MFISALDVAHRNMMYDVDPLIALGQFKDVAFRETCQGPAGHFDEYSDQSWIKFVVCWFIAGKNVLQNYQRTNGGNDCFRIGQKKETANERDDPRYDQQHFDVSLLTEEIIFEGG